jgi:hypothetical protein
MHCQYYGVSPQCMHSPPMTYYLDIAPKEMKLTGYETRQQQTSTARCHLSTVLVTYYRTTTRQTQLIMMRMPSAWQASLEAPLKGIKRNPSLGSQPRW